MQGDLKSRGEDFGQRWSEIYDIGNAELFCFWTDFEMIFSAESLDQKGHVTKYSPLLRAGKTPLKNAFARRW